YCMTALSVSNRYFCHYPNTPYQNRQGLKMSKTLIWAEKYCADRCTTCVLQPFRVGKTVVGHSIETQATKDNSKRKTAYSVFNTTKVFCGTEILLYIC